jgi:hypothetical protein
MTIKRGLMVAGLCALTMFLGYRWDAVRTSFQTELAKNG